MASMSLRKTRTNRMIGVISESIASSIHESSGVDLLPRRIPLKRITGRRISANASLILTSGHRTSLPVALSTGFAA